MAKFNLAEALNLNVSNLDTASVRRIDLALIDPNPANFFRVESDITDLAESIAVNGLLQPLVVTATDDGRYRVIAGHRRRMALLSLAEAEPDKWGYVDCKVVAPASPELEMLALIQTNTAAREISYFERNTAAEQVERILVKLQQEQGVQLPGKMRANVAKIIKASESQLARAKYIMSHLVEELRGADITDDAAYKLAHLPAEQQRELHEHYRGDGIRYTLTTAAIKHYCDNLAAGRKPFAAPPAREYVPTCYKQKRTGGKIPSCDYCAAIVARRKQELPPDERCPQNQVCCNCYRKYDCTDCCPHLAADVAEHKQSDEYAVCQRLRAARESAGLSRKDLYDRLRVTVDDVYRYESGAYRLSTDKLTQFCKLYNANPSEILGFASQKSAGEILPPWHRYLHDGYELPEGALCLVLVRDPTTPAFVTPWAARWKNGAFVSAINGYSKVVGNMAGFISLPELPEGCSFSLEVVPSDSK